jgi:hypothetical protein
MTWHPKTGYLWVRSGSDLTPPSAPYPILTWYGIDVATGNIMDTIGWYQTPGTLSGRPRAIAFSPTRDTAYVGCFSINSDFVQMFIKRTPTPSNIRDVVWLNFGGVEQVPAQFNLVLVDELMKTAVDLRSRGSYEFVSFGEKLKRSFTLVVGRPESIREELRKSLGVPGSFELGQNFPNPFNPVTTIGYGVPVENNVSLKVCDLPGRVVEVLAEGIQGAGRHAVVFSGKVLASGTYYYRMVATARDGSGASFTEVKRLVLIK